jgi:lipooligosaccharide transport system permease protein
MTRSSGIHPGGSHPGGSRPGGRYLVWEYLLRCWRRYLLSSLAEAVGTPLLYLLALGVGLGSLIDSNSAGQSGSVPPGIGYLDYIAPALLVAAAIQVGVGESSYPAYSRFKWTRVFWGITATPVTPGEVCDGEVLFNATRMLAGSTLYYLVLLAFGAAGRPAGVLMIPIAMLTGLSCAVWVLALGARMRSEGGAFNVLFRFVLVPMTLFSGSFFPITEMPLAVRWLAWISPLWHGNELARGAALGAEFSAGGGWAAVGHLAYLSILLVAGLLMARGSYRRRLVV